MITTIKLKKKFLNFFKEKNHFVVPNSSLIPENDPTVLFTTAGMHPLVPYLLGEEHPQGKRLCGVQKCVRTGDINEVGDDWHLSFFEMLGNWSLGDYFKEKAIEYTFEFLTKEEYLGIPPKKIAVTCFEGDKTTPRDTEPANYWKKLGVNSIHYLGKKDNWWGPVGESGPCGPDTEVFYLIGENNLGEIITSEFIELSEKGVYCEIWNNVFMEYNQTSEGLIGLKQKNVDTGMGVERTVAVLNGFSNVYEVDSIKPMLELVLELIEKKGVTQEELTIDELKSVRIIVDHLRASVMILLDGITPSNVDQGYVLRRFIRRSIRHAKLLGLEKEFCEKVGEKVIEIMKESYPELITRKEKILLELRVEEKKFFGVIENGLRVLEKKLVYLKETNENELNAKEAFDLFQSFGFPIEMTKEICEEKGFNVDESGFNELLVKHQELSRVGAEQKFRGGLASDDKKTLMLHTTTHLLLSALKKLIEPTIEQKGSNINSERIRFDFNLNKKLSSEEKTRIEEWINNAIRDEFKVKMEVMPLEQAKLVGAHGTFDSKYEEQVKVYTITGKSGVEYSKEICGGPHALDSTGFGVFRIVKEESSSAGVRRIKAVLG